MKRRDLLVGFVAGAAFTGANTYVWQKVNDDQILEAPLASAPGDIDPEPFDPPSDSEYVPQMDPSSISQVRSESSPLSKNQIASEFNKRSIESTVEHNPIQVSELSPDSELEGAVIREPVLSQASTVGANPAESGSSALDAVFSQDKGDLIAEAGPKPLEGLSVITPETTSSSPIQVVGTEALPGRINPIDLSVAKTEVPIHVHSHGSEAGGTSVLEKVRNFENEFVDDIYLNEDKRKLLHSLALRLEKLQSVVGHGNFNVLSLDHAIRYGRKYSKMGRFTREELTFMDEIFETRASDYGFFGDKVSAKMSDMVPSKEIIKVPYSGHYLFRDVSLAYYEKLKGDVGRNVILTSGIRSNIKQMYLFLNKTIASDYNLSKASRSLAPPGHSYHGVGDFDVGRIGWGAKNFTGQFAQTDEFKRMEDLGYIQIRYTADNQLGVRYEPWHIKVV